MMQNISIRKMRIFIAAVEERSFSKAAIRENISQPAATIIANEIEETLDCELFQRRGATRKAELTPKGVVVAQTFSRILAGYDGEMAAISALKSNARKPGRVLIQTPFVSMVAGQWLASMETILGGCNVSFESACRDRILAEISSKEATIGIIDGRIDGAKADHLQIGGYRLLAARSAQADPRSAVGADWLFLDGIDPHLKRRIRGQLRDAGFTVERLSGASDIQLLGALMRETERPAVIPDALLPTLNAAAPCRVLEIGAPPLISEIGLITQWGRLTRMGRRRLAQEAWRLAPPPGAASGAPPNLCAMRR